MLDMEAVQKDLGYTFSKVEYIQAAFSHKSYIKEHPGGDHNEKLEFLGDAVIDVVVSDLLMRKYQEDQEGSLSRKRASVVNEDRLFQIAKKYSIPQHVLLGHSEKMNKLSENPRIVASVFEAVVGAIYKDSGFDQTFVWVSQAFKDVIEEAFSQHDFEKDYKTRFQEWVQEQYKVTPQYRIVSKEGPDHARVFEMEVYVKDELWGKGQGGSKKAAAQAAAQNALERVPK